MKLEYLCVVYDFDKSIELKRATREGEIDLLPKIDYGIHFLNEQIWSISKERKTRKKDLFLSLKVLIITIWIFVLFCFADGVVFVFHPSCAIAFSKYHRHPSPPPISSSVFFLFFSFYGCLWHWCYKKYTFARVCVNMETFNLYVHITNSYWKFWEWVSTHLVYIYIYMHGAYLYTCTCVYFCESARVSVCMFVCAQICFF